MEVSFNKMGKPAMEWLSFRCRSIDIHTMRKHALPHDFYGETLFQRRLAQLQKSRFGLPE